MTSIVLFSLRAYAQNNQVTATYTSEYVFSPELITLDNKGTRPVDGVNRFTEPGFERGTNSWSQLVGVDSDVQNLINAMSEAPDSNRQVLIKNTIAFLKKEGVWEKLDFLHIYAAHSEQAALLDWKRNHDATAVNSPTFTVDKGFLGDGSTSYLNTNFTPATDGVNYTLNEASFGVYSQTNKSEDSYDIGSRAGPNIRDALIMARNSVGSTSRFRPNQNGGTEFSPLISTTGLIVARRTSSAFMQGYQNGLQVRAGVDASTDEVPEYSFFVGSINHAGSPITFSTRQYTMSFAGAAMTEVEQLAFYEIIQSYLTAIGAEVGDPISLFADETISRNTDTTYDKSKGSVKIETKLNHSNFTQPINIPDTKTYDLIAYAYTNGDKVTESDVVLYSNGEVIDTKYEKAGNGWYKLSGTVTGANESREYGVQVKEGKTVYLDDFTLARSGHYTVYPEKGYRVRNLERWETFGAKLEGDDAEELVRFQFCHDDGQWCEDNDRWMYWNGSEWTQSKNIDSHANKLSELEPRAIRRLPTRTEKMSVKTIFNFRGESIPTLKRISLDYNLASDTKSEKSTSPLIQPTQGTSIGLTHVGRISNAGAYERFYYTSEVVEFRGNINPAQGNFDIQVMVNGIEIARRPTNQDGSYSIPLMIPRGTNNVEVKIASLDTDQARKRLTLVIDPTRQLFPPHLQ